MDVPYFIKEHLSISASNEATLKKYFVEVNPRQSWPWKQNGTKDFKKRDSIHARQNSHYKAWSHKKKKTKTLKHTQNLFTKKLKLIGVC